MLDADCDVVEEVLPVEAVDTGRFADAAQVLERALSSGQADPHVAYLLGLAYKRQGKTAEARAAFRKIANPDANVLLQLALLSIAEQNLAQAEGELTRAWEMDSSSFEVCYNLLLTRLTLGQLETAVGLMPRAIDLGGGRSADDRRFLVILQALLKHCQVAGDEYWPDPVLSDLPPTDEQRLVKVIRGLGQLDAVHNLFRGLAAARPRSQPVREAYLEATLVKAKELMERGQWTEAEHLLTPLANDRAAGRIVQIAVLNLLGCCTCLTQDFRGAVRHFAAAVKLSPNDPRLHQNLALAHEFLNSPDDAEPHWNRYFDLMERTRVPSPPGFRDYADVLAFEGLSRLAARWSEKEQWTNALGYVQRAAKLRPDDPDALERLFHLYQHAKRPQDARRTLDRLHEVRPGDPQLELYELDLQEVKGLNDIERMLSEIDRVLKRFPGDARVADRAVGLVGNIVPLMSNLCDQLTDQMAKVIDQVRSLPNYQINWGAVREVMRDLLKEFQKLRRIVGKCLPLVTSDEHRRIIRDLGDHIDKKMEVCRSMGA